MQQVTQESVGDSLERLYQDEVVQIQLDKEALYLQLTFLQQPEPAQFQTAYQLAIGTAKLKGVTYWLSDARQIKHMVPENQAWLAQNMKQLLSGQLKRFAILMAPECFVLTNPNRVYDKVNQTKPEPTAGEIKIHFDKEAAKSWVLNGEL
ncbi:MAG: hypothetical protein ACO1OQ_07860 [Rufibacter sp.]